MICFPFSFHHSSNLSGYSRVSEQQWSLSAWNPLFQALMAFQVFLLRNQLPVWWAYLYIWLTVSLLQPLIYSLSYIFSVLTLRMWGVTILLDGLYISSTHPDGHLSPQREGRALTLWTCITVQIWTHSVLQWHLLLETLTPSHSVCSTEILCRVKCSEFS